MPLAPPRGLRVDGVDEWLSNDITKSSTRGAAARAAPTRGEWVFTPNPINIPVLDPRPCARADPDPDPDPAPDPGPGAPDPGPRGDPRGVRGGE